MSTAHYLQSCPNCGAELSPVVLGPDSAPWLCPGLRCHRGWFVAELKGGAWDPQTRAHTASVWRVLRPLVDEELLQAILRGTSARPEQLGRLSRSQLEQLAGRVPASHAMAAQVAAALKAKS